MAAASDTGANECVVDEASGATPTVDAADSSSKGDGAGPSEEPSTQSQSAGRYRRRARAPRRGRLTGKNDDDETDNALVSLHSAPHRAVW